MTAAPSADQTAANSALPAWVKENLPPYLKDRPATAEAVWAFTISTLHEIGTAICMFYAAASTIHADHWPLILTYATHFNWIPVIAAIAFPAIRGRTAFVKAQGSSPTK